VQTVRRRLGIGPGETTSDYEFTFEPVACLGSCALAPVVVVDETVYGAMTPAKTDALLDGLCSEPAPEEPQDLQGSGGPAQACP
jgi:NADH-quinone oxidoreductase subunit E